MVLARSPHYADELLDDIDASSKAAGPSACSRCSATGSARSEGAEVDFTLDELGEKIRVFTTRVDTIYGATCVILAPGASAVAAAADGAGARAAKAMIDAQARKDPGEVEKEGFFTGRYAINPFSGETVPIWVGNFVLMGYGTGAIMAVPAHDERDFEFCTKYGIPMRPVIRPVDGELADASHEGGVHRRRHRREFRRVFADCRAPRRARKMTAKAESEGFGKAAITYRIKDWGISRQRYWGTPIPVIHCPTCGMVPVPDEQLPVVLPLNVEITGKGRSPLADVPEFVNVTCPKCGGAARRETDTMDTFVDSSWYFYRYCDPKNDRAPFDPAKIALLVPDRSVHRRRRARHPAPDLLALLHQGDARHRPDHERRARRSACSRRAW